MQAYLVIIFLSVASSILNEFKETWPPSLYWLPFLNYCRSLALLLRYGGSTLPPGSAVQVCEYPQPY